MEDREIIDACAHIGKMAVGELSGQTQSVEECLNVMDEFGIKRAFLSPIGMGRQTEGIKGTVLENNNIAEAIQLAPERFPIGLGIVEPRHEEKAVEEAERILCELRLQGITFPFSLTVGESDPIRFPVLYEILEVASRYCCLCFIHSGSEPIEIGHLARKFPRVTFIIGHPTAISDAQLPHAIEVCQRVQNVYVDMEDPTTSEQIEIFVGKIGSHKILFGSGFPVHKVSHAMAVIEAADISDEDKENIFWRNAEGLIAMHCVK